MEDTEFPNTEIRIENLYKQMDEITTQRDKYRAERDTVQIELNLTNNFLDKVLSQLGSGY